MPNFNDIVDFILTPDVSKIIVIVLLSYLVLLWVALVVWVTKDIISRTNNIVFQILSILLVAILNIFGMLIYVAIRPSKTLIEKFFEDLEYEALVQETRKIEKVKKPQKKTKKSTKNNKKSKKKTTKS